MAVSSRRRFQNIGSTTAIDRNRIGEIARLIRSHVRKTPVISIDGGDIGLVGKQISLKLELLQYSGSFKVRGVFAHLLTRTVPEIGVAAASGGNHGAAVAFAAMKLGIPAKVFVPEITPKAKLDLIRKFGADVVVSGKQYSDALAASKQWVSRTGALSIHAYDDEQTLLGQGTIGAELDEQMQLDTLLIAVGGGGLIGGIAAWYSGKVTIIGVEPAPAPTLYRALEDGQPVAVPVAGVAADSLGARKVGDLMFPIARRFVNEVVLLTDDEIRLAQKELWAAFRIVAEPGGAAAFGALVSGKYKPDKNERVGVIICGGNTSDIAFVQ